ncbi:MAG: YceI family protein [Saprospiraceae bacterium]
MKIIIAFILLLATVRSFGQIEFGVSSFSMSIKGTSNLHDWESSVKELKATGAIGIDAAELNSVKSVSVEIPVKAIKSTKGRVMDNKTYDAFKANDNPFITYTLESATVTKKGDGYDVATSGKLTMAGVTNKVDMMVRARVEADGSVTFSGSKKLKLSEFKMKRPSALLGTVTVGDEVEVVFKVSLKPN